MDFRELGPPKLEDEPCDERRARLMKRKFNHYLGDEPPSVDLEENYMDPEALNM